MGCTEMSYAARVVNIAASLLLLTAAIRCPLKLGAEIFKQLE